MKAKTMKRENVQMPNQVYGQLGNMLQENLLFIRQVINKVSGMYKMKFFMKCSRKHLFRYIDDVDMIKVNINVNMSEEVTLDNREHWSFLQIN